MIASPSKLFWLLITVLSALAANTVSAGELTSSDLHRWLDPHNRADIGKFRTFMKSTDAKSAGGYDGIYLWDLDHAISFEGMPVKFIGADGEGSKIFLTFAVNQRDDMEALANRYFCGLDDRHITLNWASHLTSKSHLVIRCGRNYNSDVPYEECIRFISEPRYRDGSHNALAGCEDLVFDFTTYTDKDVCLGFTKRKDFRDEEHKRGLECDAWFAVYQP